MQQDSDLKYIQQLYWVAEKEKKQGTEIEMLRLDVERALQKPMPGNLNNWRNKEKSGAEFLLTDVTDC